MIDSKLHLIVYTSQISEGIDIDQLLSEVMPIALVSNAKNDITGALFFHQDRFLQVLEGPENKINQLMNNIQKDTRHTNVEIILNEGLNRRSYEDWSMNSFNLSDNKLIASAELKKATEIYKENLVLRSDALTKFYESYLKKHAV